MKRKMIGNITVMIAALTFGADVAGKWTGQMQTAGRHRETPRL